MKVGIFYFSLKPGKGRQRIILDGSLWGYVRVDTYKDVTLLEALDRAKPHPGETVLNTVEVEA